MELSITITEQILADNPDLGTEGYEVGEVISVELKGDRPPKPPHNG